MGLSLRVALDDGHAENMGDGMFVLFQTLDGAPQSVTLSRDDLARMLDAC
ncbi:hypothetical protein [Sphingomonas desiccabilis]|nr:hypothetical protein [Sphingomonas desiccabilis]